MKYSIIKYNFIENQPRKASETINFHLTMYEKLNTKV